MSNKYAFLHYDLEDEFPHKLDLRYENLTLIYNENSSFLYSLPENFINKAIYTYTYTLNELMDVLNSLTKNELIHLNDSSFYIKCKEKVFILQRDEKIKTLLNE